MNDRLDLTARTICREQCAVYGEPSCFGLFNDQGQREPWPNPNCDELGCQTLAKAVLAAIEEK